MDESCSGRPSTLSNLQYINQINELILSDHRLTIGDIVDQVLISFVFYQAT